MKRFIHRAVAALGALAGMSREAVHAQLRGALDAVVHVGRDHLGRRVQRVGVLRPGADGLVTVRTALRDNPTGPTPGPGWEDLAALVADPETPGVVG